MAGQEAILNEGDRVKRHSVKMLQKLDTCKSSYKGYMDNFLLFYYITLINLSAQSVYL